MSFSVLIVMSFLLVSGGPLRRRWLTFHLAPWGGARLALTCCSGAQRHLAQEQNEQQADERDRARDQKYVVK
jgi:hypothetical protein